jgi:putative ABC transport system substrate-binding protein
MRRRDFITLAGGAVLWPAIARAQQVPRIGYLSSQSSVESAAFTAVFLEGLGQTGYVEGKSVAIDYRWAEGKYDRLPAMASDLTRAPVNVIVATSGAAPALAAKRATDKIPIVFITGGDPVKTGLVTSLSHPGGNITGVTSLATALLPKQIELLHQLVPKAIIFAELVNAVYPEAEFQLQELREAAAAISKKVYILNAGTPSEIDAAFDWIRYRLIDALVVADDPFFASSRNRIVAKAASNAVPAIYPGREFVDAGGLMSYGASAKDTYRLAGVYTGRILKGQRPADLPVVQSERLEFVVNGKAARELGLTIPPDILMRADEVIE